MMPAICEWWHSYRAQCVRVTNMLSTGHEIRMNNSSKPNCIAGVVLVIDFFFWLGFRYIFILSGSTCCWVTLTGEISEVATCASRISSSLSTASRFSWKWLCPGTAINGSEIQASPLGALAWKWWQADQSHSKVANVANDSHHARCRLLAPEKSKSPTAGFLLNLLVMETLRFDKICAYRHRNGELRQFGHYHKRASKIRFGHVG